MRTSLAIANQHIRDTCKFQWIHENKGPLRATLEDLVTSDRTLMIPLDAFSRLASVYLDKIVSKTMDAAGVLHNLTGRQLDLDELTLRLLLEYWRTQSDFRVYESYDYYFVMEGITEAAAVINEKTCMSIIDARSLSKHRLSSYTLLGQGVDFVACVFHAMVNSVSTGS